METPISSKSDPSFLLLNEIEILLAQTRLMELYLKQAQVSAAHNAARAREQHLTELATLHRALAEKEQAAISRQNTASANEKALAEQIDQLQLRVTDQQSLLAVKENQRRQADAEITSLHQRISELELAREQSDVAALSSAQACRDLESALDALRLELENDRRDFQHQQRLAQDLHQHARQQLEDLENQLVERQICVASTSNDLQRAKDEITRLNQRVAELQAERQELTEAAVREVEQARRSFEAELSGLQSALAERDHHLQQSQHALSEIERSVTVEVQTLRHQFEQNHELLDLRERELRDALAHAAALQQRLGDLESAHKQAAIEAIESERLRGALQSEIASLQHEVAVRERALTERQEAVTAVELALHGRIQGLQQELARSRNAVETREHELAQAHTEVESLRERMARVESSAKDEIAARHAVESARDKLETDLANLMGRLAEREAALSAEAARFHANQEQSAGEITELRGQVQEQRRLLDQSAAELEQLRGEIARLRERSDQTEARERELTTQLQASDDVLRAALAAAEAQKAAALAEQENNFQSAAERLRADASRMRDEIDQKQQALTQGDAEIERLRSENTWLREQNHQWEHARHELEGTWQQSAALCQELETRLQAKDEELRIIRATAVEQREAIINEQAARFKAIEEQHASEIARLSSEIDEHRRSGENAYNELARLGSEVAGLQAQTAQSDARQRELEAALQSRVETLQAEQGNLERARHELSQLHAEMIGLREANGQLGAAHRELEEARHEAETQRQELIERLEAKENELAVTLSNAQAERESALREQAMRFQTIEEELRRESSMLRSQLEERQTSNAQRQEEFARLNAEIIQLHEQTRQAEQSQSEFEQKLRQAIVLQEELEARLCRKEEELQAQQSSAQAQQNTALAEQEARFQALDQQRIDEISDLRRLLEQQQSRAELAHNELREMHSEVSGLREQSAAAQAVREEIERQAALTADLRDQLSVRLQAKDEELRAARATAEAQLATALREREQWFTTVEGRLTSQIAHLRGELAEQERIAASASKEVTQLRAELVLLHEKISQSEQSRRELEQNWQQVAASRQELEAHLEGKDEELRASLLSAAELKHRLDSKFHDLETDLADKQALVHRRDTELDQLKAESSRLSAELAMRESVVDNLHARLEKEIEFTRTAHQTEIVGLREEYILRQQTLEKQLAQRQAESADLRHQIEELERRADRAELEIRTREQTLAASVAECAALREHLLELENRRQNEEAAAKTQFDQARNTLDAELIQLRQELEQKGWALAQQQAMMENLALAHKQQLQKLEERLNEQQNSSRERNGELGKAQLENRSLRRRLEELESELQEARETIARRAEQISQDYVAQIEKLRAEIRQQAGSIRERETALSQREQSLRAEIDALVHDAQEKNKILENRNDELVRVKSDRDLLQERFQELESATKQNELLVQTESEQMRSEFQAQLALLQAELSQKEWALEEQRAYASGLDQQYREQLEALNRRLAEVETGADQKPDQFVLGEEKLTREQQERYKKYREVMDTLNQAPDRTFPASESRRWRTRLDWKRRWRS
ncbi:MAG TPA: hypothetical protein VMT22_01355 [Terriglobales bacterium]|nr:hypothetical protein [Terriglobales bacterium]